jgi:hypothetical protein
MTLSGIETATFRIVAQFLNHCATACPNDYANSFHKSTNVIKCGRDGVIKRGKKDKVEMKS